jgi:hypothetical protein
MVFPGSFGASPNTLMTPTKTNKPPKTVPKAMRMERTAFQRALNATVNES